MGNIDLPGIYCGVISMPSGTSSEHSEFAFSWSYSWLKDNQWYEDVGTVNPSRSLHLVDPFTTTCTKVSFRNNTVVL